MIVIMQPTAKQTELDGVLARLKELNLSAHLSRGVDQTVVGVIGKTFPDLQSMLESMPGVDEVVRVSKPFKLASREFHPEPTIVRIGDVVIGGTEIIVMAGPCSVEGEEQVMRVAEAAQKAGARMIRGGAFKPRTSPYSFRGLAESGLKMLAKASKATGMPIITEVMATEDVPLVAEYSDILQIGARNMQNFNLLEAAGAAGKPVLVKRGLSGTIEEWLLAAEYVLAQKNPNVILCERGIRTFETYTRNTLDISAIPAVHRLSHLPVLSDPSHGTGKWHMVAPMAAASIAAGADGLLIEVHPNPDHALSDGPQSLTPANFAIMMDQLRAIAPAVGRTIWAGTGSLVTA